MRVLFDENLVKKIIGNRVKCPNGPAAVMTEPAFFGKSRSLGNREDLKARQ